jgi:hypothetical protein
LLAVGGGLASAPATALELGEIQIQSALGQPLRASIAYALGPNESIAGYCVSLSPGAAANGLPAIVGANLSVADGVIALTSTAAIREPLMTVRLNIGCPYTPNLIREYMLFFDPSQPLVATPARAVSSVPASNAAGRAASSAPTASRAPADRTPIDGNERYRVQVGDSLSLIAQRIENRPVGLWTAVAQIFDANPDAFLDGDPNRLMAGSWLVMPNFVPQAAFSANVEDAAPVAALDSIKETASTAYPGFTDTLAVEEEVVTPEPPAQIVEEFVAEPVAEPVATTIEDATDDTAVLEPVSIPSMADLQPGDVILDTELDAPSTAATPNVPVANIITTVEPAQSGINWLLWLVGAGIALIAGLFVFGRRGRGRQTPAPAQEHPQRRSSDNISESENENENENDTETFEAFADVDYDLSDDSPTQENLVLDADLEIGTGLDRSAEVDVAQDFGFAVTTHLDLELPDETAKTEDVPETDIIAPINVEDSSILNSEVLPEDDDDDYDMSVIVDATKMPVPEEVTERDLMAVVVDNGDETLISGDYTISKEVDYDIVEQDYEDELTATQALNMEIERAAAEIAERMENDEAAGDSGDMTSELPLATVTALDVTANLPAGNDDEVGEYDDSGDTGPDAEITKEMLADDKTVEMPAKDDKKAG